MNVLLNRKPQQDNANQIIDLVNDKKILLIICVIN